MANGRKQAELAATRVLRTLAVAPGEGNLEAVTEIIELALHDAAREREKKELQRIAEVQASAHAHLSRLLNASPAVIYCRRAADNFQPTFVSDSITKLFGVTPREYFDNPDLWKERVHPDDIPLMKAWVERTFTDPTRSIEYRYRRKDGTYCWVHDRQHILYDEKGEPVEIIGSWTDVTERKQAEEARQHVNGSTSSSTLHPR